MLQLRPLSIHLHIQLYFAHTYHQTPRYCIPSITFTIHLPYALIHLDNSYQPRSSTPSSHMHEPPSPSVVTPLTLTGTADDFKSLKSLSPWRTEQKPAVFLNRYPYHLVIFHSDPLAPWSHTSAPPLSVHFTVPMNPHPHPSHIL